MATEKQIEAWNILLKQWRAALQEMRAAQHECTKAFAACAQGNGTGPTLEQLAVADKARELEHKLAQELDQLSKNMKA